LTSRTCQAGNA